MTKGLRENVLKSAIHFLRIPEVRNSSLAKKIAFLEFKGLTKTEIHEALRLASSDKESGDLLLTPYTSEASIWKRCLAAAAAVSGVSCGLYYLLKESSPKITRNEGLEAETEYTREYQTASSSTAND
ncbi:hypothetical protein K493DRAFT_13166 [Basidiobolus meristosporus CBS 931.73]|uniref:Peroxisomal membrane protein PEX14 n=1 Tax=Basidiobolus meristosporus CBS 931.73 TaxID=1314790 RepID=A0A1Y1Z9G5_9FUNG|nr:hypothetical protein K493DRAFT_13166 [Basidiobolus meristosporus CBS 931.73]|eukprot:ORY06826.1 hypothetical protein K493DRAFT_13166 [Basidiobolus meristosporus CBS 931.73]